MPNLLDQVSAMTRAWMAKKSADQKPKVEPPKDQDEPEKAKLPFNILGVN